MRVHENQLLGTRQSRHLVCSRRDGKVDVSATHHGKEMRSVLVAENIAEIRDATSS